MFTALWKTISGFCENKGTRAQGHSPVLRPNSGAGCQTHFKMQKTMHHFGRSFNFELFSRPTWPPYSPPPSDHRIFFSFFSPSPFCILLLTVPSLHPPPPPPTHTHTQTPFFAASSSPGTWSMRVSTRS